MAAFAAGERGAPDECWNGDHIAKAHVERLTKQLRAAAGNPYPRAS